MLRLSGEICGSLTHCRSKTSSGFSTGFTFCATQSAGSMNRSNAATPIRGLSRGHSDSQSFMPISLACHPAVTLMFIDDSHGLHERVANSRSDETEASLLEIFAHRVAVCGRLGNAA